MSTHAERFGTPSHPDGCPLLVAAALAKAEAEVARLAADRDTEKTARKDMDRVACEWAQRAEKAECEVARLTEQKHALVFDLAEKEQEVARLREAGEQIKLVVSEQMTAALSGQDESLRYQGRFIRWGLVEKRIYEAIDNALKARAAGEGQT